MNEKINITVDGRNLETRKRVMLLEVLNEQGIPVPQLCNHPSLPPSGACRLCVVEITKKEWNGRSRIVTSCLYPAEDGLIISTRSAEVLKTRRSLLELYLAQCPGAEEIKTLARLEGIDTTPFEVKEGDDKCILCGLCTRACQDCGPGAITTLGRGVDKLVGPNPDGIAGDCTGCRACVYVCPTDAIPFEQKDQVLKIWGRDFEIPVCSVQTDICRGCGICEEVCPFSIPRVMMSKDELPVAQISPTTCVGCGICAGSCPTGAIRQNKTEALTDYENIIFDQDLKGKNIVFVCPRSPMPAGEKEVIRVSCIGSVDISTLLYCVAAGADSVALMCRDRLSCPYHRGGDLGERYLTAAEKLLNLCGMENRHLGLLQPYPGREGPYRVWQEFKQSSAAIPAVLEKVYALDTEYTSGLDLALDIVGWLKDRPELKPALPQEITSLFEPGSKEVPDLLYLDRLPELHLLLSLHLKEPKVLEILNDAAKLLQAYNMKVRCVFTEKELQEVKAQRVVSFNPSVSSLLPPQASLLTLNELAGITEDSENGIESSFSYRIDAIKRKELLDNYTGREEQYLCLTPDQCLQYALLLRQGSWQHSLNDKPAMHFAAVRPETETAGELQEEQRRIGRHPILPPLECNEFNFTFNLEELTAREGEVISSALYAAGITVLGHHHRDGGAQGIYCVNGQCSQCMVVADGKPVKACMTPVTPGMEVESVEGPPALTDETAPEKPIVADPPEVEVDVLIVGGGPAGISAAIELGNAGVEVLIVDDKQDLGGKLSLQTHNFFGSVADCYAGYRGVHIGHILADELKKLPTVKVWLNSAVVGVFSDKKFGVSGNGTYTLINPKRVLFSTGAREKSLAFPGSDLPGVYGAGAFQTLVNRDLVRCAEKLFIIGGGNVGLIGAYHALQAGIDVVGLVEALPQCGGYKVHEDKIKRLGVPVWTSHTVLRIEGEEEVERVVIAEIDDKFQPVPGSERKFEVDTVLMAVGLNSVEELFQKAKDYGIEAYAAGDAREIAEASAAIFSGKIIGRRIAQGMGIDLPVPSDWEEFGELLKHHSSETEPFLPKDRDDRSYPLIRCMQEIPCNPCTEACPNNCIAMPGSILALPEFRGECIGCGRCVLACPGLAITLVVNDYDPDKEKALLMLPYEFVNESIPVGNLVTTTDMEGNIVGSGKVIAYKDREEQNSRRLLLLEVPAEDKLKVAGFRIREPREGESIEPALSENEGDDPFICRCERVRKSEIVEAIRSGVRDMNQLKAMVRAGLGGCNGKTCTDLILRLYKEEGIPLSEITMPTHRPLVAEVHLGDFAAKQEDDEENNHAGQ